VVRGVCPDLRGREGVDVAARLARAVDTDWETAMGRVVAESRPLLDQKEPLSHGFYTSG
jgi:hypothetical protein